MGLTVRDTTLYSVPQVALTASRHLFPSLLISYGVYTDRPSGPRICLWDQVDFIAEAVSLVCFWRSVLYEAAVRLNSGNKIVGATLATCVPLIGLNVADSKPQLRKS